MGEKYEKTSKKITQKKKNDKMAKWNIILFRNNGNTLDI